LFGDQYRNYRQQVRMLIPLPFRKAAIAPLAEQKDLRVERSN
jgi:hypothetical protein